MAGRVTCDQCPVADRAVCAVLTPQDRAALARTGQQRRFVRGETILAADARDAMCGTLLRGAAKLTRIDSDGTERIAALVHPAGMLGQLFASGAGLDLVALTDSEACLFPRARFEALAQDRPELALRLLDETLRALGDARVLIDTIGRRTAIARVAALLIAFSRAASPAACHAADRFELPLTRGEMAALLGTTIETISRSLTTLETRGLIMREGTGGIAIRDAAGLAGLVD